MILRADSHIKRDLPSSLIQTILSAPESHRFNVYALAGFTAGMEFHQTPKTCYFVLDFYYRLEAAFVKWEIFNLLVKVN